REKQALELEAIRQHHAREQGRAQQAQEQTLAQQATLAAQEAQHQAEKDRIAADQLRQEGEMRSATSKHEQQLATIAALSSVPRETLLMNADSDMKVQAMANVLLAQIVASHNLQPEQILALATMLQPIAAQQANHQTIRNGITPPDLTQFFQARPAQQRHLHLSFLNENGHEVTRAAVNDDFILQIDLAQKGYFALFAFGTGRYFSQLFPTTLVLNTALDAGRYLLPGERLLPLPNAFFGPEVERMYFDEAGQEVLLGCLLPSKPSGELAQWLRPLEPDSRLSDARMQAILSALDECADAGIMLASITIEPARSRFR
ncbi:MAG: hypothetical protein RL748_1342, partial [Pseudomonadota bacterium]